MKMEIRIGLVGRGIMVFEEIVEEVEVVEDENEEIRQRNRWR